MSALCEHFAELSSRKKILVRNLNRTKISSYVGNILVVREADLEHSWVRNVEEYSRI